jgi:tetratricopeptide (TPR) repeat protein
MNDVVRLHPEDLLDKLYAGTLVDDERERLDEHLAECPSCQLELELGDDLSDEAACEEQESAARLRLLVQGAVGDANGSEGAVVPGDVDQPGSRRFQRMARWSWLLAAVVITGSAAAAYLGARAGTPASPTLAAPPAELPAPATARAVAPSTPVVEVPAAESSPDPLTAEPDTTEPAASPSTAGAAEGNAGSVFAAANRARRAGRRDQALALYRQLQRDFPDSREARVSQAMTAGLIAGDDPEAAVKAYDAYLDDEGRLGEEALVGRAEALGRLGRRDQEAASWRELLRRHPESIHAPRAQARLAELARESK